MTKVRKQKRQKKYRYNVHRKRMNKRKFPTIENKVIKEAWSNKKSSQKNMAAMGLVHDVNVIKPKPAKTTDVEMEEETKPPTEIVEKLEQDANALRVKTYKLPKNQVEYLSYLLDTYGEDYKAMAKDKRNYLQHTWKKIRSKIRVFKSIPEQYNEYLKSRNKEMICE